MKGLTLSSPSIFLVGLKAISLKIILPFFLLTIYLLTLSPTVGLIDSGELITGCYLLNILHPTGYPLYTLLGNVISRLPFGSVAQRINFISALYCVVTGFFFFNLMLNLTNSPSVAFISSVFFALSKTLWSVAVSAEVYGLTTLFLGIIVWLWTKSDSVESKKPKDSNPPKQNNSWLFLAFILGLSFTNHMMIFSTFLGTIVFLMLLTSKKGTRQLHNGRTIILATLFFLLGLSVYLYLIIRAKKVPLFNWGNPYNWERFFWHITGRQYQVWMFKSTLPELLRNLKFGVKLLYQESIFGGFIVLAIFGGWQFLTQKASSLLIGLLTIFLLSFFYAVNYSIPDIDTYYLPCIFVVLVLSGMGLKVLIERTKIPHPFFIILIGLPLLLNYRKATMQDNYLAYDAAVNHLKILPKNAIVITNWWDFYSPSLYLQYVEKYRTDICIIDKELLRRSWYFQYLAKQYPWLVANSKEEIKHFLFFLDQFEHNRLKDNVGIQNAFIAMINSFVDRNPDRRVFVTFNNLTDYDAKSIKPEMSRIPYGLLYELTTDTTIDEIDYNQFIVRKPKLSLLDARSQMILERYEAFGIERDLFLKQRKRLEAAKQTLWWVLKINPQSAKAKNLIRLVEM